MKRTQYIIYSNSIDELINTEEYKTKNFYRLLRETFGGEVRISTNLNYKYRLELVDFGHPGTNFSIEKINFDKANKSI